MPRAHRNYIHGCVWHITHRCHKQEFLLKFEKDRKRWRHWLFEAKKRYGLSVLNYMVTSNHIHLLVVDTKEDVIPKSLQLIVGRTAQECFRQMHRHLSVESDLSADRNKRNEINGAPKQISCCCL